MKLGRNNVVQKIGLNFGNIKNNIPVLIVAKRTHGYYSSIILLEKKLRR